MCQAQDQVPEWGENPIVTELMRASLGEFTANGGSYIQPPRAWQCAGGRAYRVEQKTRLCSGTAQTLRKEEDSSPPTRTGK